MSFVTSISLNDDYRVEVYIVDFEKKEIRKIYKQINEILEEYQKNYERYITEMFLHVSFNKHDKFTLFEFDNISKKLKNLYDKYENFLSIYVYFPYSKLPEYVREILRKNKLDNNWNVMLEIVDNIDDIYELWTESHTCSVGFAVLKLNKEYMKRKLFKETLMME